MKLIHAALGLAILPATSGWTPVVSNTTASFRGLSAPSAEVIWISGTRGIVLRSIDGGTTWVRRPVAGADSLDLRDIEALDSATAIAISSGPAEEGQARVFRTTDGGATWARTFTTDQKGVFLDAISFWDRQHGIILSDPVGDKLFLLATDDGGATWAAIPSAAFPAMLAGEAAFAASGTALAVQGSSSVWIATGGATIARVFRSTDRGRTWSVAETPVHSGDGGSAGIFSVAFADAEHGVVVGGNYTKPKTGYLNVALSSDGGATWRAASGAMPMGYLSGVAYIPHTDTRTLVATGLVGTAVSVDGGEKWDLVDTTRYNSVAFVRVQDGGWAVGDRGRIAKWTGRVAVPGTIKAP